MSVLGQDTELTVPRKKPHDEAEDARDRIDLRADPAWIARVQRQADRRGISLSAYIRQATSLQLEQDEATDRRRKPKE